MNQTVNEVVDQWQILPNSLLINPESTRSDGLETERVDLRSAALVVAIDRLAKVSLERGIWP